MNEKITRRIALWDLYTGTNRVTGRLCDVNFVGKSYFKYLKKRGYVKFLFQHAFAKRAGLSGWNVYEITPAGVNAIFREYGRNVWHGCKCTKVWHMQHLEKPRA